MSVNLGAWIGFNAFVIALLALDLGVFHRKAHAVSSREAAAWSAVWIFFALAFGGLVWNLAGENAALQYYTGWLIEKTLSVDNLFVFLLIFSYFRVPPKDQHRVLFWGILGALVMRGIMIGAGAYLIHHFHWVVYIFGALLLVTAVRLALEKSEPDRPRGLRLLRLVKRVMPVTEEWHGSAFFIRRPADSRGWFPWVATPLFLVLVVVEASDLIFAVDSIPAIFAVTRDPFIVFTSNVFAILGLRALYFLLAGIIPRFRLLKPALSIVLVFVAAKMLLSGIVEIPLGWSLGIIATVLLGAVTLSILETPSGPGGGRKERTHQRGSSRAATRRWSDPAPLETSASTAS